MTKISSLTAQTASGAAENDLVNIIDVSAGSSGSKKMTVAELRKLVFSVITTGGDLLFRDGDGAQRLPIGDNGQVLQVSGGDLTWGVPPAVGDNGALQYNNNGILGASNVYYNTDNGRLVVNTIQINSDLLFTDWTANRVLGLNGDNYMITTNTTLDQLDTLSGIDGNIQDQLNEKIKATGWHSNSGTSVTLDGDTSRHHSITLTDDTTFTFDNVPDGGTLVLEILAGSYSVSFADTIKWAGGDPPAWSTVNPDLVVFIRKGSDYLAGLALANIS